MMLQRYAFLCTERLEHRKFHPYNKVPLKFGRDKNYLNLYKRKHNALYGE